MESKKPYFGGAGITYDKLVKLMETINVDGTTYKFENWLKEVEVFENLIPGKSLVWIPYGGAECYGVLSEVVWCKYEIKHYSFRTEETMDWWFYEPYLIVKLDEEHVYYVYEYTYYKKIKHKVRSAYATKAMKEKRKFLSAKDISEIKRNTAIENSFIKRKQ